MPNDKTRKPNSRQSVRGRRYGEAWKIPQYAAHKSELGKIKSRRMYVLPEEVTDGNRRMTNPLATNRASATTAAIIEDAVDSTAL